MISKGRITQPRTGRAVVGRVHQYDSQYVNNATKGKVSSNALLERRKFGRSEKTIAGRRGKAVYRLKKRFLYAVAYLEGASSVNPPLIRSTSNLSWGVSTIVSRYAERTRPNNKKKRQEEVLSSQVSVPPEDSEVPYEILNSIDKKIRKGLTDETLIKMIAFIIKEIYTNNDIRNAETEKKFDILLSLFYNQFKDVFETHTIIVPIFLNYLVKTIKKAIVPSGK